MKLWGDTSQLTSITALTTKIQKQISLFIVSKLFLHAETPFLTLSRSSEHFCASLLADTRGCCWAKLLTKDNSSSEGGSAARYLHTTKFILKKKKKRSIYKCIISFHFGPNAFIKCYTIVRKACKDDTCLLLRWNKWICIVFYFCNFEQSYYHTPVLAFFLSNIRIIDFPNFKLLCFRMTKIADYQIIVQCQCILINRTKLVWKRKEYERLSAYVMREVEFTAFIVICSIKNNCGEKPTEAIVKKNVRVWIYYV